MKAQTPASMAYHPDLRAVARPQAVTVSMPKTLRVSETRRVCFS